MPDWSYQPLFRPLLFRLSAERARRVTIGSLAAQARLPGGQALFRALAPGSPPPEARTSFLGMELPSMVGIGAGIDVDGRAAVLLGELGVGFVEVGPMGLAAVSRRHETDPVRVRTVHGLGLSPSRGGPAVEPALAELPPLHVQLGVHLRGPGLPQAVAVARARSSFLTLPPAAGDSASLLRAVRAAAEDTPVLVRVLAGWEPRRVAAVVRRAQAAGIDGMLVVAATPFAALSDGELVCNGALPRALALLEAIVDRLPVALSGGVITPQDALDARAAGAGLVALTDGLVYAGPGLPQRIDRRLARKTVPSAAADPPQPVPPDRRTALGRALLGLSAAALTLSGVAYVLLAATVQLLPNDTDHLGMSVAELCRPDGCRIVDFIAHDRASFGGVVTAIGVLYAWLVAGPLRRNEPWAWWVLLLSGAVGYLGFLSFLGYGYFDTWHGAATVALIALWAPGLALTRRAATGATGLRAALRQPGSPAWTWSPAGRGRLALLLLAGGLASAGLTIVAVAITTVFVPQDTAFLQLDRAQLDAIDPRLVPVIAHDRAEFGAGLLALGLLAATSAWKGIRPGAIGAWRAFAAAGAILFATAYVAHPAIGYTTFVHLAPVYAGVAVLVAALVPLRRALRVEGGAFADV